MYSRISFCLKKVYHLYSKLLMSIQTPKDTQLFTTFDIYFKNSII